MLKVSLMDAVSIRKLTGYKRAVIFCTKEDVTQIEVLFFNIGIENLVYADETATELWKTILKNKDQYYIWMTDELGSNKQFACLTDMGFGYISDFNFIEGAHFQLDIKESTVLDPNLGHGTKSENNLGVRVIGSENPEIKIAVIGASLVDETYFSWKLWPQILCEKLLNQGTECQFLLGGCYAYTTTQCYVKLLRDILPNKPDIVLDYSPWENDCFYGMTNNSPFVIGFQKGEMSRLRNVLKTPFGRQTLIQGSRVGYSQPQRTAAVIVQNIQRSRMACEKAGVKYICILPPSVTSQKSASIEDVELKWSIEHFSKVVKQVWKEVAEQLDENTNECIWNLQHSLDAYPGIFYDFFHMYEDGNDIMADQLMELLENEVAK